MCSGLWVLALQLLKTVWEADVKVDNFLHNAVMRSSRWEQDWPWLFKRLFCLSSLGLAARGESSFPWSTSGCSHCRECLHCLQHRHMAEFDTSLKGQGQGPSMQRGESEHSHLRSFPLAETSTAASSDGTPKSPTSCASEASQSLR